MNSVNTRASADPPRRMAGLIAVLALLIAGLAVLDRTLAGIENAEVRRSARHRFETGKRLLDSGDARLAVEPLRQAHELARDNSGYTLELIPALVNVGKTDEADALMNGVLADYPNDGDTDLTAARLKVAEGKPDDAEAYYHRAIYGAWPRDAVARRRSARLELIKLLVRQGAQQQLLAELISLEAEAGSDKALQMKIADLFLLAKSPSRAAAIYRTLTERDTGDSAAYQGLGEAELQEGQYRAAQTAFQRAGSLHDGVRLRLLTELTELDPTPRRLTSLEKYSRSRRILDLAKGDLESRLGAQPKPGDKDTSALLQEASGELAKKPPRTATNEMAEHELDLAERIWKARLAAFGPSTSPEEEALRLCMDKLLQTPAS